MLPNRLHLFPLHILMLLNRCYFFVAHTIDWYDMHDKMDTVDKVDLTDLVVDNNKYAAVYYIDRSRKRRNFQCSFNVF